MSAQPIVVVLAADSMFIKQLTVVIEGISKSAQREHQIFVFHDGYEAAVIDQVSRVAGEAVSLCWIDARSGQFDDAQLPAQLPTATLFRLRIGDLLPEELERVIYIDTDVAVCRPLDGLWDVALDEHVVAAVRDPVVPWAAAPLGLPWSELGLPADTPYFNAGVLAVDTGRWRSQRIAEQALDLLAARCFHHGDQCALNTILAGNWEPIGPEWNLQAGHLGDNSLAWVTESHDVLAEAIDDPAIVHFTHSALRRPWEYGCSHPYRDLWFDQLDLTPWAGWRPAQAERAAIARRIRNR